MDHFWLGQPVIHYENGQAEYRGRLIHFGSRASHCEHSDDIHAPAYWPKTWGFPPAMLDIQPRGRGPEHI